MGKIKKLIAILMFLVFIVNDNNYGMKEKEKKQDNNITLIERIKDLPYFEIFIYGGKVFSSLAHSIVNSFYKIETLHMNRRYSLKKYLCWGYMFQPAIMSPFSFLDFYVNILGGIIDSAIFLLLSLSKEYINTLTKVFYIVTSPFNINLNLKITKDFYIAINLTGILRAGALLFLIKDNENDNIIDEWEKIKEEKKISEEDDNKIKKIYSDLKNEFNADNIFDNEASLKLTIFENECNYNKVKGIMEEKLKE